MDCLPSVQASRVLFRRGSSVGQPPHSPLSHQLHCCLSRYNVKSYSHGLLPTRFLKPPEVSWAAIIMWSYSHGLLPTKISETTRGIIDSVSPITWSCDMDSKDPHSIYSEAIIYLSWLCNSNLENRYSCWFDWILSTLHTISSCTDLRLTNSFWRGIEIQRAYSWVTFPYPTSDTLTVAWEHRCALISGLLATVLRLTYVVGLCPLQELKKRS